MNLTWTAANVVTLCRLALSPALVALILWGPEARAGALSLFVIGALADRLDGTLARRLNQTSGFGAIWDPVVDKIWLLGAMVACVEQRLLPTFYVWVCLAREMAVMGARAASSLERSALAADSWGKWKTRMQSLVVLWVLLQSIVGNLPPALASGTTLFLELCAGGATVWSGYRYLMRY